MFSQSTKSKNVETVVIIRCNFKLVIVHIWLILHLMWQNMTKFKLSIAYISVNNLGFIQNSKPMFLIVLELDVNKTIPHLYKQDLDVSSWRSPSSEVQTFPHQSYVESDTFSAWKNDKQIYDTIINKAKPARFITLDLCALIYLNSEDTITCIVLSTYKFTQCCINILYKYD